MTDVEITRFRVDRVPLDRSDIIAHFNCRVGEFGIWGCTLRIAHSTGELYVALPGKARHGFSIALDGEVRPAIFDAVCERYRQDTGRWPG